MTVPDATVAAVLAHAAAQPPLLGEGRLVCIDGPAGSGKTTLAAAVAEATGARVLHMDDHYEGWQGLGDAPARIRDEILAPLATGLPGFYRRYDWDRRRVRRAARRRAVGPAGPRGRRLRLARARGVPRHPGLGHRRRRPAARARAGPRRRGRPRPLAAVDGRRAGALHRARHRRGRRPAGRRVSGALLVAAPAPGAARAGTGRRPSSGCPSPGRCRRRRGPGSPTVRRAACGSRRPAPTRSRAACSR